MRHLTDLQPSPCGCGVASHKGVLISIPTGNSPGSGDASTQTDFKPIASLAASLHDSGGIVGFYLHSIYLLFIFGVVN